MTALLILMTLFASISCCKSFSCLNGGKPFINVCICRPGTGGVNCTETVTDWTTGKNASQSTTYAPGFWASYAIDGWLSYENSSCSLTKEEVSPWWSVHLGAVVKVDVVAISKYNLDYHRIGYQKINPFFSVYIGINTKGEYYYCSPNSFVDYYCYGEPAYLVLVLKYRSIREPVTQYMGLCEVIVYGTLTSDSPCLSNPCGNGGSCEPKETGFYICVCPETWPGQNCEGKNWARGQNATISGPNGTVIAASNTVDGNRDDVMRRGDIYHQCSTTTRDITSPWWKVELGKLIEVTHVYIVNRVECEPSFLKEYVFVVGPYNGIYTQCRIGLNHTDEHARFYFAWLYVWCLPHAVGSTVKITYTFDDPNKLHSKLLMLCEVEVYGRLKPCASNPCSNGGTCRLLGNTENIRPYECSCPANWVGSNCETTHPCICNPCDNGGTCELNNTSYACLCPAAWTGINCRRKKEVQGLSISAKVLVGVGVTVGVVAVGAGAAAAGTGYCTTGCMSYSGDITSKFGTIAAVKAVRSGVGKNNLRGLGEGSIEEQEAKEEDDYSAWSAMYQLWYGEE